MDYDRRSAVSSFYGGRKSTDALNTDLPSPSRYDPQPGRVRIDSGSSFYGSNGQSRASPDALAGSASAGYNHRSFMDTGRVEPVKGGYDEEDALASQPEESWDVFADFNNQGPRYSNAFGLDKGYRQVPEPVPLAKVEEDMTNSNPVEMITVPALGPEWKASELRGMTKKGKREAASEARAQKWTQWKRDERGLCGKYFTRKVLVWTLFATCIAVGIVLAFTIPRVPGFQIDASDPLLNGTAPYNETIPTAFSRSPANFSFAANADLQVDTASNFLPLTFNSLHAEVYDLNTDMRVAQGDLGRTTFPAKTFSRLLMPLNFSYSAVNSSDATWVSWYNSCRNSGLNANGTRPTIQFRLLIDMHIAGLIGKKSTSTQVTDAACPIELSLNSV